MTFPCTLCRGLSNNVAAHSHWLQTATAATIFLPDVTLQLLWLATFLDHNLTPSLCTIQDTRSVKFLHYDWLVAKRSWLGVVYC